MGRARCSRWRWPAAGALLVVGRQGCGKTSALAESFRQAIAARLSPDEAQITIIDPEDDADRADPRAAGRASPAIGCSTGWPRHAADRPALSPRNCSPAPPSGMGIDDEQEVATETGDDGAQDQCSRHFPWANVIGGSVLQKLTVPRLDVVRGQPRKVFPGPPRSGPMRTVRWKVFWSQQVGLWSGGRARWLFRSTHTPRPDGTAAPSS